VTAICTLCGTPIVAEPDGLLDAQRDDRTFGRLGASFKAHMEKVHKSEPQRCIDPAIFQGNTLSIPQLFGVLAITVQGVALFSYLDSQDPVFLDKTAKMREVIIKAMEPKAPARSQLSMGSQQPPI
jgi:hypothetical protein